MDIKPWEYADFPAFNEPVPGATRVPTTGDEIGVTYHPDVPYATAGTTTLHLQILVPQTRNQTDATTYPCMVHVQGSAWMKQDRTALVPTLSRIAERGFVVRILHDRSNASGAVPARNGRQDAGDHSGRNHGNAELVTGNIIAVPDDCECCIADRNATHQRTGRHAPGTAQYGNPDGRSACSRNSAAGSADHYRRSQSHIPVSKHTALIAAAACISRIDARAGHCDGNCIWSSVHLYRWSPDHPESGERNPLVPAAVALAGNAGCDDIPSGPRFGTADDRAGRNPTGARSDSGNCTEFTIKF